MAVFSKIEGAVAILRSGGIYKQVDVYVWRTDLYAAVGGGFVGLYANGGTTKPKMSLVEMDVGGEQLRQTPTGRLTLSMHPGDFKPVTRIGPLPA